jgi:peptidylprolyl isomerase
MTVVGDGDTIRVHYTGTLPDGSVFDSSRDREPLEMTVGSGEIIPGFEAAVRGMKPGDKKQFTVSPEHAYGDRSEDDIHELSRDMLPDDLEPAPGDQLELETPDGESFLVTVTGTTEDSITVDANHPLAGQELTFDVELLEIV